MTVQVTIFLITMKYNNQFNVVTYFKDNIPFEEKDNLAQVSWLGRVLAIPQNTFQQYILIEIHQNRKQDNFRQANLNQQYFSNRKN